MPDHANRTLQNPQTDARTYRRTQYGPVIGRIGKNGSFAWLGIPYAAPPIGTKRWRAPTPPTAWADTRDCTVPGDACCQPAPFSGNSALNNDIMGTEDCLYLNIWSPPLADSMSDIPEQRLPVMLWVHGGGNTKGQGCTFDGGRLASTQSVLVVTINFRLGIFGWFRHAALYDEHSSAQDRSGNYGILDILCALQWVRDNIASFGGDPQRVTLLGESAGGSNVFAVLASPLADGLFQRVIIQSGIPSSVSAAEAERFADDISPGNKKSSSEILLQLIINDGLADDRGAAKRYIARMPQQDIRDYLYGKSFADFSAASQGISSAHPDLQLRLPQLFEDGAVLPASGISQALTEGRYCKVPTILGSTRDEYSILIPIIAGTSSSLLAATPNGFKVNDHSYYRLLTEYLSLLMQADCVDEPANSMQQHQRGMIYTFRFDWDDLLPAPWLDGINLGATHGLDVAFVFGHCDIGPEYIQLALINPACSHSYEQLAGSVMAYWAQFAWAGTPNGGQEPQPHWSSWCGPAHCEKLVLDAAERGGIRMAHAPASKPEILKQLQNDPRFASPAERQKFFEYLRDIRAVFRLSLEPGENFS
jgi:para-nitrobenzyl esterase